ncbi:MAG: hypothetical protein NZM37_00850 [Sandaracinaceae bacterium]|nr:hypothetical protein [Sandaracinaceae bacterium]
MRHIVQVFALLCSAEVACGSREVAVDLSGESAEEVPPLPEPPRPPPPPPDRLPDGSLIEGEHRVGGLRLPRAVRYIATIERQHLFEGPYPPEAYVRYFGPRLITGRVDALAGGGARYVEATPRDVQSPSILDILISPAPGGKTLITIDERSSTSSGAPPPEAELVDRVKKMIENGN